MLWQYVKTRIGERNVKNMIFNKVKLVRKIFNRCVSPSNCRSERFFVRFWNSTFQTLIVLNPVEQSNHFYQHVKRTLHLNVIFDLNSHGQGYIIIYLACSNGFQRPRFIRLSSKGNFSAQHQFLISFSKTETMFGKHGSISTGCPTTLDTWQFC